eukprot:5825910-Amphidinium_carterae.1
MIAKSAMGVPQAVESDRHLDVLGAVVSLLDPERPLQIVALLLLIAKLTIGDPQVVKSDRHLDVLRAVVSLVNPQRLLQKVVLLR